MNEVNTYIEQTLGVNLKLKSVNPGKGLPFFISKGFEFYTGQLFDKNFVLVITQEEDLTKIKNLEKTVNQVSDSFNLPVIVVFKSIPAAVRKRLVGKGINFIVPFKQMFLPSFLIDFKEERKQKQKQADALLPSAQAILIFHLLGKSNQVQELPFKDLADKLGYSQMAITKAVKNLQELNLCKVEGSKEKFIHFGLSKIELWNKAMPYLVDPVLRKVFVDELPEDVELLLSNESALPEYSDMNPGTLQYRAIDKNLFYALKKRAGLKNLNEWEGNYWLEIWKYDPVQLAEQVKSTVVDPLSLYLTMKDMDDARIEMALESIIEKYL